MHERRAGLSRALGTGKRDYHPSLSRALLPHKEMTPSEATVSWSLPQKEVTPG